MPGLAAETGTDHIGVWYFTLWNSRSRSIQVTQSEKIYGRADPWGGVRDYAEGRGGIPILDPSTQKPVDFSNRKPLLGFYDLMDPKIVTKEIDEGASEGINFFAFYWYFNAQTGEEESVSAPTSLFFSSPERGKMKMLLAPIALSESGDQNVALSAWKQRTVPKLIQYMQSDVYYRIDGRPLLIDFGVNYHRGRDEVASYTALREAAKAAGIDPLIIRMLPAGAKYGDMAYFQKAVRPDGFACFAQAITGSPEPYARYIADWIPQMTAQITPTATGTIVPPMFIPCGSIGQDSRPWYQIGHGAPGGPNAMKFTEGTTPPLFREHLISLKDYIAEHRALTKGLAILYAWNEWGEAAADIEPSAVTGYEYADIVRDVFHLTPRARKPAVDQ